MTSQCVIHHWLIDMGSGSLIHQVTGEQRRLGEYQLKLLIVLVQNAGKILTREELNTLVWERRIIGNNSLPNAIHALRVALEDDGKQQRIIKTVPKKGYILEAEYCDFLLEEEIEEKVEVEAVPAIRPLSRAGITIARAEWQKNSLRESVRLTHKLEERRRHFWRWICLAQGLVLVLVAIFLHLQSSSNHALVEQEPNIYSNIRFYALNDGNDPEELNKLLNPSQFALNAMLATRQITMRVYFQTTSTTLNYTMVLTSSCDRRQLAMNIAQFRSDNEQLNALIYRETERKSNEMANCRN